MNLAVGCRRRELAQISQERRKSCKFRKQSDTAWQDTIDGTEDCTIMLSIYSSTFSKFKLSIKQKHQKTTYSSYLSLAPCKNELCCNVLP